MPDPGAACQCAAKRRGVGPVGHWLKKTRAFFLAMLLGLALCAPAAAAEPQQRRVVTVAFPESAGINEVYEDGTYGGMTYDWLHEIAKYTGWEYEFVTGNVDELLSEMIDGKYDLMGGMFYFDGYEKMFNYPAYLMGTNYSLLIYHQDDDTIKSFDYTTLNGKRIGVLRKATGKIARLEKFLDFNNLDCTLVYYDDEDGYENCLARGEVDLLYGSDVYMKNGYNVAVKLESDPYYLVTALGEPELCAQLSEAMEQIYSADPNFAVELYEKYFPEKYINSISFTAEEQAFIQASDPIRVAVIKDRYPLLYQEEGATKGVVQDCIDLIAGRTGLSFTYVYADSYAELEALVEEGKADIIGCYLNGDHAADEAGLARTTVYAKLDSVILRNKRTDPSGQGLTFAVPQGRDVHPESPAVTEVYYPTYAACLEAVNRGEADYTQMPFSFVEDLYAKDYYANVTLSADMGKVERLTLAVPSSSEVPLYSVLNKAVNNLSEEELEGIVSQNILATRSSAVTFKTLLYNNPLLVICICVGLVMLAAGIIILLNMSQMRTKVMRVKLEKAEETSRAKSDFLSRMSHEIRTPMNAIIGLTNLTMLSGEASPALRENLTKIDSSAQFLLSLLNDILDMSKIESQKMELETAPFDLRAMTERLKGMFELQMQEKGVRLVLEEELDDACYLGDELRISQVLTNLLSNASKFTGAGGSVTLAVAQTETREGKAGLRFSVRDSGIGIKPEDLERVFGAFEQAQGRGEAAPGTGLGLSISRSLVELMGGRLCVESTVGQGSEFYFTIRLPVFDGELAQREPAERDFSSLEGLRALLAEDNDINAEIATELLRLRRIEVERAADGRQAAELFAHSPQGYFDVILMDINMPVKNGLEAAREIRVMARADARTVPILAMTANTFQEDRDQAMAAGMTGFLPKPFDVEQLYRALQDTVPKRPHQ